MSKRKYPAHSTYWKHSVLVLAELKFFRRDETWTRWDICYYDYGIRTWCFAWHPSMQDEAIEVLRWTNLPD